MAAYAAVNSLLNAINRLRQSSHISISDSDSQILTWVYLEAESLGEVLERSDDYNNNNSDEERVDALDGRIRDAVCELEDKLDSHVSDQFLSRAEQQSCIGDDQTSPFSFSLDIKKLIPDFYSCEENVKRMKEQYIEELSKSLPDEDEKKLKMADNNPVSLGIESDGKIVGLSRILEQIKSDIRSCMYKKEVKIYGMAGSGKTTLVKEVFGDPSILKLFQHCVWVTVGPKYQRKEILQNILSQIHPDNSEIFLMEGETRLCEYLCTSLKGKKYLIVLDDVWDPQLWYYLEKLFPDDHNGSHIFLTSRLNTVGPKSNSLQMRLLDKEKSWELLSKKMFGDVSCCPPQLVKSGKEIAENCDGLPLTIVTVAGILSKREKTPEYWNEVAANKQHSIFMDAYEKISEVTISSYKYLPQSLKASFLYMGVYSQNYVISTSKLCKLWIAEGFFGPNTSTNIENSTARFELRNLLDANVVIALENSSERRGHRSKTCRLHSVFWYLSNREATKNKLFHVSSCHADCLVEGIKSERRLSVQNGVLFSIKDVYDSLASITTLRSLLYTGPYHQYPVPVCSCSKLLSVLDTLAIRFYQFPIQVLELMHLRYLAITCNRQLPALIFNLWNLQYLIVHRHLRIRSCEDSSYLPIEIWKMKELKHLEIMGSNLPDPCGFSLPKLLTLLGVGAHTCTKKVFESIPNLTKLGIRIELTPGDDVRLISCFSHICHLGKLESLKCVVVNPKLKFEVVTQPTSPLNFPSSLKKLSLSGLGYPWECMGNIVSLPNLEILKLRSYAFNGPVWKIPGTAFQRLDYLLLEDTDLVSLDFETHELNPGYCHLILRHCYKLKKLCWPSLVFGHIDLFDCDPSASKQIKSEILYPRYCKVGIHFSWEEVKLQR